MISLAAKSQTELRFVDGSQATIYGSASLQVQHDGFSLRGGQAAINTVQALSVGLPDCSLQIQAGSRLRLDATRLGAVTVLQGSVTIHRGNLHTIIPAGSSGDGWRIYPALDQALHAAQTLQTPNHPCRWSLSILCDNTPLRVQHSQGDLELRENSLYGLSDGPQPLIPATRRQFLFDADALGTTLRCEPGGQILQLRWTTPPIAVQGSEVSGRFIVGVPILAVEKVSHSSISPH
jgi:hypothetical protein